MLKVAIVDGFYKDLTVTLIHDPKKTFFDKYLFDLSMEDINPDSPENVCRAFLVKYNPSDIEIEHLTVNPDDVYEPGWIFVQDSQTNLRKYSNSDALWIALGTPDGLILHMVVYLRQLGYGLDSPIPDDECEYLISTPIPPNGGEVDVPSYIFTRYMQYLSYRPGNGRVIEALDAEIPCNTCAINKELQMQDPPVTCKYYERLLRNTDQSLEECIHYTQLPEGETVRMQYLDEEE